VKRLHVLGSAVLVFLLLAALPAVSAASGGTSSSVMYRTWTITSPTGDIVVSQVVLPIAARVQVRPNLDVTLSDAGASSNVDLQSGDSDLSGATAFSGQAFFRLAEDRVQLQAGATVPSGNRGMNPEQTGVLRLIGLPLLNFGLRHYGRGSEFSVGATVAFPRGSNMVGSIGTGYIVRGSYELFEGVEEYDPASEWAWNMGVDVGDPDPEAEGLLWRADATLRIFGTDRVGGSDAFQEGHTIGIGWTGSTHGPGFRWNGLLRAEFKGDNTHYGSAGAALSQIEVASGNAYFLRWGGTMPMNLDWRVGVDLEWSRVTGSDEFGQDGYTYGFGPSLERDGRVGVRIHAGLLAGQLDASPGSERFDLHGFATGLSIRWGWGT
jgi:hypothetical protein